LHINFLTQRHAAQPSVPLALLTIRSNALDFTTALIECLTFV
jgi:hypothetical protein